MVSTRPVDHPIFTHYDRALLETPNLAIPVLPAGMSHYNGGHEGIRNLLVPWLLDRSHEAVGKPRRSWKESNRLYVESLIEPDLVRDHIEEALWGWAL